MNEQYVDVADRIAQTLVRDVIRDGGDWQARLGGDLYEGTSGIGLFLATMDSIRPNAAFADAARSAIRHALASEGKPSGLFTGEPGIALAAHRSASLLDDLVLRRAATDMLDVAAHEGAADDVDVLSGAAGTILALVHSRSKYVAAAVRLGDRILERGNRSDRGWSWTNAAAKSDFAGMSVGAAGIGLALLELHRVSGEQRFRDGGFEAFRYARAVAPVAEGEELDFGIGWCHGAAGIGLACLRAYELTDDAELRADAENALQRTQVALKNGHGPGDFSLCHGRSGIADLFLVAAAVLEEPALRAIADDLANRGRDAYHVPRRPWPCGVDGAGETPGLMLGLAGIGYFYLRAADPGRVPSVLV